MNVPTTYVSTASTTIDEEISFPPKDEDVIHRMDLKTCCLSVLETISNATLEVNIPLTYNFDVSIQSHMNARLIFNHPQVLHEPIFDISIGSIIEGGKSLITGKLKLLCSMVSNLKNFVCHGEGTMILVSGSAVILYLRGDPNFVIQKWGTTSNIKFIPL